MKNTKVNVKVQRVGHLVANGYVYAEDFCPAVYDVLCTELGVVGDVCTFNVDIEFDITWDGSEPIADIASVVAYQGDKWCEITKYINDIKLSNTIGLKLEANELKKERHQPEYVAGE